MDPDGAPWGSSTVPAVSRRRRNFGLLFLQGTGGSGGQNQCLGSFPQSTHFFWLARRERIEACEPADKRTLIRRATLRSDRPAADSGRGAGFSQRLLPDAFGKVVDRLLASPRYGERWGRHWLDVARYADSNGLDENLVYKNACRYRDYVIAAFNKDKPYDRFVQEQLAGDLLPPTDDGSQYERWTATGFLSLGAKMLAEDDPVKMEMDIVDEQLDTRLACLHGADGRLRPLPRS